MRALFCAHNLKVGDLSPRRPAPKYLGALPEGIPVTVTVRLASDADAAVLHALAAATFALACPPETTQASIDDFIARNLSETSFAGYLADPARDLLIVDVDDAPAGYTMLVAGDPTDPDVAGALTTRPTIELSKVYVLGESHGAGVGSALIGATVDAARRRGAAAVWLGVNQFNQRANRFYEKHGFVVVGTKKFLVGERYEDDFVRELVF
jgi:GNAT superfamily N-acetyltransferase